MNTFRKLELFQLKILSMSKNCKPKIFGLKILVLITFCVDNQYTLKKLNKHEEVGKLTRLQTIPLRLNSRVEIAPSTAPAYSPNMVLPPQQKLIS